MDQMCIETPVSWERFNSITDRIVMGFADRATTFFGTFAIRILEEFFYL